VKVRSRGGCHRLQYGLLEDLISMKTGKVVNPSIGDYLMASSFDIPRLRRCWSRCRILRPVRRQGHRRGPDDRYRGCRCQRVEDAIGVRIRDLPITPEKFFVRWANYLPTKSQIVWMGTSWCHCVSHG